MQQTSELNLDIIEEDIPNKFSLDRAGNDNTNSHDFGNDDLTRTLNWNNYDGKITIIKTCK